jgi:hypothetical protein
MLVWRVIAAADVPAFGSIYLALILPYIHNPTPTIIAKMIIPTIKDATTFMRNTAIAIITINAIIPTIINPIVPAKPK